MEYNFRKIEQYWQDKWKQDGAYKVPNPGSGDSKAARPKFYVLDMFPYPSGAGLHVGHPLGYIASDIYARYKRLKGFNVLHPMGYDAFGLPAEQYAIEHGIHPAVSTEQNIANFRQQLDNIGFSFDWNREIKTSDPAYYKWTQWIFLQLFDSFYDRKQNKAERIAKLVAIFEKQGNKDHPCPGDPTLQFSADEWENFETSRKMDILMQYRLAYCGYGEVNWCEALGTVLANDEVINGVSERGGYPVVKKKLRQWYLRITEYADRLLEGLERVDFSDAMKEMQTNWIGKSSGAEIDFRLSPNPSPSGEGDPEDSALSGHFFQTADKTKWGILKDLSRENRKNKTEAEDILWQELRNNKLGSKVRRQHVIDGFIIDFAFLQKMLLVEVDGGYHESPDQKEYDKARTEFLTESGYRILRFTNEQVINDKDSVIEKIKKELQVQLPDNTSPPLADRRGVGGEALKLRVYTTRPDTIFGVDFMVIAPEHELVEDITSDEQHAAVEEYITYVKSRSERERMAEKKISGVFTGGYALNPFNGRKIPVWISEYVLAGYGTGAIMAVPCGDERDHKFAKHFNIPITNIIGKHYNGEEANPTKDAVLENSDFINGMVMRDAIDVVIKKLEEQGIGVRKVNYKMRDAAFSRQRYWGEPFPIKWIDGVAYPLDDTELPLELPQVDSYKPGPEGEGPLANIPEWVHKPVKLVKSFGSSQVFPQTGGGDLEGAGGALETNTMPGYAGSSWYFLRFMDPHNDKTFCDRKVSDYWNQVDLYIGGTEHAVGHLLYSRMWTKGLYDLGYIGHDEPFKKLVNQGMITAIGYYTEVLEFQDHKNGDTYVMYGDRKDLIDNTNYEGHSLIVVKDLKKIPYAGRYLDSNNRMTRKAFGVYSNDYKASFQSFIPDQEEIFFVKQSENPDEDYFTIQPHQEKMSKSKYNVENPDELVEKYGADTFRMYEMFLGPVEMSKPWDTKGIEGVHRFLKKFWRLFMDEQKGLIVTDEQPTAEELKVLHKAIKKIEEDTERFSFNTGVSSFMIATNDLTDLKTHKRAILEPLLILLTPYAPHIAEELYKQIGGKGIILDASYPVFEEKYVAETSKEYPISINGKMRTTMNISLDAAQPDIEQMVLQNEVVKKWLEGKQPKKIIYVKNKMVNVVV